MKFRLLTFALSIIMLLGLLTGCTPKTQDSTESYTVPNIESGTEQLPDNETAAPTGEPAATESKSVSPESETANANEPSRTEHSSEEQPSDPAVPESDPSIEDDDPEIESDYSFEVGDNLGVGGN